MFSSIQQILRKSGIDLMEDHLRLLKMTQLVPQIASFEPDSKLQVKNNKLFIIIKNNLGMD